MEYTLNKKGRNLLDELSKAFNTLDWKETDIDQVPRKIKGGALSWKKKVGTPINLAKMKDYEKTTIKKKYGNILNHSIQNNKKVKSAMAEVQGDFTIVAEIINRHKAKGEISTALENSGEAFINIVFPKDYYDKVMGESIGPYKMSEVKEFGEVLFGDFRDKKEKDTKHEKKLFKLLRNWIGLGERADGELTRALKYLLANKEEYSDILEPTKNTLYRATLIKLPIAAKHGLTKVGKKATVTYKSKSEIQSWTTSVQKAEDFADSALEPDEHEIVVILSAKFPKKELLFKHTFLNKIGANFGYNENEIIRVSNKPKKVEARVAKNGNDKFNSGLPYLVAIEKQLKSGIEQDEFYSVRIGWDKKELKKIVSALGYKWSNK